MVKETYCKYVGYGHRMFDSCLPNTSYKRKTKYTVRSCFYKSREYSLMVKFFSVIEADAGSNPVVLVLV